MVPTDEKDEKKSPMRRTRIQRPGMEWVIDGNDFSVVLIRSSFEMNISYKQGLFLFSPFRLFDLIPYSVSLVNRGCVYAPT
jgi:hypothetical protein